MHHKACKVIRNDDGLEGMWKEAVMAIVFLVLLVYTFVSKVQK